jgi:Sulfatase
MSRTAERVLLVTYDSCRYDVLQTARTPVLDRYGPPARAQTPGNFTYPAHQAFFVGHLPHVLRDRPYYNRFSKQLLGLERVGEKHVSRDAMLRVSSPVNLLAGLRQRGYQVVGTAAMSWFQLSSLTEGFEKFRHTGVDAEAQVDYLLSVLDIDRPFFAFVNFGETHAPFHFRGKVGRCPLDVRAASMSWPPLERGRVGRGSSAFAHQVESAEFLDVQLEHLLQALPRDTVVVVCGDHGECFGEDGYWGHGFNHPKVLEVPLSIFRIDGTPLL